MSDTQGYDERIDDILSRIYGPENFNDGATDHTQMHISAGVLFALMRLMPGDAWCSPKWGQVAVINTETHVAVPIFPTDKIKAAYDEASNEYALADDAWYAMLEVAQQEAEDIAKADAIDKMLDDSAEQYFKIKELEAELSAQKVVSEDQYLTYKLGLEDGKRLAQKEKDQLKTEITRIQDVISVYCDNDLSEIARNAINGQNPHQVHYDIHIVIDRIKTFLGVNKHEGSR